MGKIEYCDGKRGTLIYLKASLTGHESSEILEYEAKQSAFPHEGTDRQFYTEDQFESYRNLGRAIALEAFEQGRQDDDFRALAKTLEENADLSSLIDGRTLLTALANA